jgi:hypothetical protein
MHGERGEYLDGGAPFPALGNRSPRTARARGPMAGTPFNAIEIHKNMPPSWQKLLAQLAQ